MKRWTLLRFAQVLAITLRHALGQLLSRRPQSGPERLRQLLEDLGGTFIKFGQVMALQPDVLPRAYCNALFDLLDRVPPFAYREVERIVTEELGRSPTEAFSSFEPTPMASASIGQVHVATLDGRKLAVKVRRPTAEEDFAADLRLMRLVARGIRFLRLRRLDWMVRAVDEFSTWTHEELDYRYESRFMEALGHNSRDDRREAVPDVVRHLTTAGVLTAEFLEGPMVLDYIRSLEAGDTAFEEGLRLTGFDPEDFARNIVRNFVSDAFHHGLFHADLHPANLLILPDSAVGYVDFGITGSLSHYSRRNLVGMTLALTRADADSLMEHFLRLAVIRESSEIDRFRDGLDDLVAAWYDTESGRTHLRSNFTRVMVDMLKLSRETDLWPTPDVIRYIRSVITADGLIQRFAPRLDVGGYLQEICEDSLRRELWREWLSVERIADWTADGARIMARGPGAMLAVLRQLTDADDTTEDSGDDDRGELRARALQQGLVVVAAALVVRLAPGPLELGWNLFTAGALVAAAAATMLLTTLRRVVG